MSATDRRIVVVTGASRGAGKGIALALGALGAKVYVTGRSLQEGDAPLPGTIGATAEEIDRRGGQGVAAHCDHRDDAQVAALFERIKAEDGLIDILVNNATALHDDLIKPEPFWEKSPDLVDILDIGLRSAYVASFHAARLMAPRGRGLIVATSSFGAGCFMHGPAYGAQKAGLDKMMWDIGVELKPFGVAAASIWMGPLLTERTERAFAERADQYEGFAAVAETPQFTGRIIDALARDPALMSLTGQTLIGAELALKYGLTDRDGKQPPSYREMLGPPRDFHPAIIR
jgi:NAD(P)-dependent dehydrogenase (short-subunit alcohol dehydrogenase family)